MKLSFLHEPELEFGSGGTHVDIRHGIMRYGPLDVGEKTAPTQLKVGLVGTQQTIEAARQWLDACRTGVNAKPSKLANLFAPFPGFSDESPFHSSLIFHERWCSAIHQREIESVLAQGDTGDTVRYAVALFIGHAEGIMEKGGPMVLMCLPPKDLLAAVDARRTNKPDVLDQEIDEGTEPVKEGAALRTAFHDALKADGMRLQVPIQMVRPYTYTGEKRVSRRRRTTAATLQDEATRAWNLHTALYYKAGGIPWRLLRSASDLTTCFVGISFYRSLDGERLLTSVAQVFNERGEGVIVKGAQAQLNKEDRQPHLSEDDACTVLNSSIAAYRKEHHTSPARLVVHKTSKMTGGEIAGFRAAADEHHIDVIELASVRRSYTRLFREGTYPPLRGTFVSFGESTGLLYLRGSVQFFETSPSKYVPRAFEFTNTLAETPIEQLARELLALSKLNWNNTQFDGSEPITVRAARNVGDILKCIPPDGPMQPSFRFYM